jgi:hypothetical protein
MTDFLAMLPWWHIGETAPDQGAWQLTVQR